ncbi:MAG: hypothetical protein QMC85_02700 [Methanocellales archaeon]|nr:hypothetical protein [Methanocellales archaeon]MDI6902555.1 hypothetical protein [Methanocellales archaeon]
MIKMGSQEELPKGVPNEIPLIAIFGDHPEIRIIDTLVAHPDSEYNLSELAECADVSKTSVFKLKDRLLHYGVMKPTKIVGRITLYKFNDKSPTGKLLDEFTWKLADTDIGMLVRQWGEKKV